MYPKHNLDCYVPVGPDPVISDLLWHPKHSSDKYVVAAVPAEVSPGIQQNLMLLFQVLSHSWQSQDATNMIHIAWWNDHPDESNIRVDKVGL